MMWMLSFVPDSFLIWIVNSVLIAGAIGTFFTFFILHKVVRWFPFIAPYHLILQIISVVLLIGGVYFKGAYGTEMEWRARVEEMKEKVRAAEEKSNQVNKETEVRIVEKTKVVREKGQVQIEYIDKLVKGETVEIVKDMSEAERKSFLEKQKELQDALKNCPVPKIIVEEHNKAAAPK